MYPENYRYLTLPIHFVSSNDLVGITYAKCGSRFLTSWFKPNGHCVLFNVYFNYQLNSTVDQVRIHIDDNIENIPNDYLNNIKNNMIKEYSDLLNGTLKKDILLLYRNPFERIISGIIQEFFSEIRLTEYHSKLNLTNDANLVLLKILNDTDFFDSIIRNETSITDDEYYIIQNLLLDYSLEYTDLFLQNTNHTNPQLIQLYTFIQSISNYGNQIKLVNLDNNKVNLDNFLSERFPNNKKTDSQNHHNSNFIFKKMLLKNDDNLIISEKQKLIKKRIENSLKVEMFYYTALLDSNLNI